MLLASDPAGASETMLPAALAQLLCVEVHGHRCALPLDAVVEIHAAVQLAALPDAPEVVVGLVNRRGSALAVLSLRERLGLASRPVQVDDRLVVLQLPDRQVALLVDAAVDVVAVPAGDIDTAVGAAAHAVRSQGVAVLADGLLVVLDVAAFLTSRESALLEEALHRAGERTSA